MEINESRETNSLENGTKVSPKENCVYRRQNACSETIHRFLLYMEEKGFTKLPRFLGVDQKNREILSYVEGDIYSAYPFGLKKEKARECLGKVAGLLREYHDASLGFEQKDTDRWPFAYQGNLSKEVICHNDFAPYNVTFKEECPVGIIDFDFASPGPRIWDIAQAIYRFVPLSKEVYDWEKKDFREYEPEKDDAYRKDCIAYFFACYGITMPEDFFEQVIMNIEHLIEVIEKKAVLGNEAFVRMKEEGHIDFYQEEIRLIESNYLKWI